jgi:GTP-binding protein HflX
MTGTVRFPNMENAILVGLSEPLDELRELAMAAGGRIVGEIIQHRENPDPAFFIGKGKATDLRDEVLLRDAELVLFDEELTPAQMRNLGRLLETKVIDRTGLILDIFSRRAQTREGKLQVELAQLDYRLSHLAGRGEWLSRLGGGIGTRGPGEMQLEVDRRRIRARIAKLKRELDQVRKHRSLHRDRRRRSHLSMVSLVGYTNAGKSTLFERLSGEDTVVSGRVFSTLDTIVRRIRIDREVDVLVSDTVGFIRKLPPDLVTAFRATLEEVQAADLILHVVDVSDPAHPDKVRIVRSVLEDLGCNTHSQLMVFNKSDLAGGGPGSDEPGVLVSALTGEGISDLKERILAALVNLPRIGQARV